MNKVSSWSAQMLRIFYNPFCEKHLKTSQASFCSYGRVLAHMRVSLYKTKVTFRDQHWLWTLQFLIFTTFCGLRIDRWVQTVKTVFLLFCPPLYWSAGRSDLQAAVTSTHFALWHSWTWIKSLTFTRRSASLWSHVFLLILNNTELKTSNYLSVSSTLILIICGLYSKLCCCWTAENELNKLVIRQINLSVLNIFTCMFRLKSISRAHMEKMFYKKSLFQMWKVYKLI